MRDSGNQSARWPGWSLAVLIATGLFLVVVETTSLLVLVGIGLLGVGIYGAVRRRSISRGVAPHPSPR